MLTSLGQGSQQRESICTQGAARTKKKNIFEDFVPHLLLTIIIVS